MTSFVVKRLIEEFMEAERDAFLSCRHHERTPERAGYRNGYEARTLETRSGLLRVRVPRVRGCPTPFRTTVFDRYQRRTRDIEAAVEHWVAAGQSTRAIEQSLMLSFGCSFSATTVSRILARLDVELMAYHQRSLRHGYRVIYLDGKHGYSCKRKRSGKRGKRKDGVLLTCWGIRHDGTEELVDFMACDGGESEANWTAFLTRLEARGVRAKNPWDMPLELIVTDGDAGLEAALLTVYPHVPKQRCVFHKVKSIQRHLQNAGNRAAILASAGAIYEGIQTPAEARERRRRWVARWHKHEPKAVKRFCEDFERTLLYLNLPKALWSRVRTTNPLERFHRELEQAAGHTGAWQHLDSWERHVYVIWKRLRQSGYGTPNQRHALFTRTS
jgi:transposase-like protein